MAARRTRGHRRIQRKNATPVNEEDRMVIAYANKLVRRNELLRERRKLEEIIRGIDLEIEILETRKF